MIFGIKKQRRYSEKPTEERVGFSCCIEKELISAREKFVKNYLKKFLDSDTVL